MIIDYFLRALRALRGEILSYFACFAYSAVRRGFYAWVEEPTLHTWRTWRLCERMIRLPRLSPPPAGRPGWGRGRGSRIVVRDDVISD